MQFLNTIKIHLTPSFCMSAHAISNSHSIMCECVIHDYITHYAIFKHIFCEFRHALIESDSQAIQRVEDKL